MQPAESVLEDAGHIYSITAYSGCLLLYRDGADIHLKEKKI
jgi:hypothetical protein